MVRINLSATVAHAAAVADAPRTYGGGFGSTGKSPEAALRRLVGANLLWENQYYKAGDKTVADLVAAAANVPGQTIADLAREAAREWHLRHVPLMLTAILAERQRTSSFPLNLVRALVPDVITRADGMGELLALYSKLYGGGKLKGHIPMSLKRGLADTFGRWDEYQLAKYDRATAIRLRDILFLTHPEPRDEHQAALWKRLVDGKLASPDTWEVSLSGGADKKETWERLLHTFKLGDLAFLRNLRNMVSAGVDHDLINQAFADKHFAHILPFQFIAAAQEAPQFEPVVEKAMLRAVSREPRLVGSTLIVVDVSGSMNGPLGEKSKMDRLDAGCALAMLLAGQSDYPTIFATAGNDSAVTHKTVMLPARSGMALRDSIRKSAESLGGGGIFFTQALRYINQNHEKPFDRVVVITDEQDCDRESDRAPDRAPRLGTFNYVLNIGSYDMGLKTKAYWDVVTGFSESSIRYISFNERGANSVQE